MSDAIRTIVMPKWGLAMQEGMLAAWHVEEGATIAKGQEIMDIETSKIANVFESPVDGTLRRKVTNEGETVPVGFLLGVCADESVSDAEIDAFIQEFRDNFVVEDGDGGGPEPLTVDAGGRRIRYLVTGEGDAPPVVMIHGFGGDYLSWLLNQSALADGRKVYAIDLPGHGGSTKDVGAGDAGAMSAAVLNFMAAMNIDQAHLVGHSLGGAVALDIALNHGERVRSLGLIAPAGLGPAINMEYIDGFIRERRAKKLRAVMELLVADPSMISKEMVEDVLKYKRLDGVDAALNKVAGACFDGGEQNLVLAGKLDAIKVPTIVVWGEEDKILPPSHADGLPASIKVTKIPGAGHLPMMEKAEEVNALLKANIEAAG